MTKGGMFLVSLRNFFITFLIALLIFGVCAYFITGFVSDSIINLINGGNVAETTEPIEEDNHGGDEDVIKPIDSEEIKGESFNILLVGTDYRPSLNKDYHPDIASQYPKFASSEKLIGYKGNLPEYPYRTVSADAIVLVCVNKTTRTVACINLPSYMRVEYSGGETELGDLYFEKGFDIFKDKVSAITGAEIDYFALASIEALVSVVDKIGPVTYNVPCDMEYTDDSNGLAISLKSGSQPIDGAKAAALLAYDSYAVSSGNSRAKTTLSFLITLAKKMTNPSNLAQANTIFSNISKYVYTNVKSADLSANTELIFSLAGFDFVTMQYPVNIAGMPNTNAAITHILGYIDN